MITKYEIGLPEDPRDGAPLIVLLHGRGSDRFDLQGLRLGLPQGSIVVTPEAPFPAAPWGYGPGSAWYRYLGENRPEPESFDTTLTALDEFLASIREELPVQTGPFVLGGFSQGGTTSLAYALRNPGATPTAINFSGFLADQPSFKVTPEAVKGTRIFWGHGLHDPAIPFAMARAGRKALETVGADLTIGDYPIGHFIDHGELRDVRRWLTDTFGPHHDHDK